MSAKLFLSDILSKMGFKYSQDETISPLLFNKYYFIQTELIVPLIQLFNVPKPPANHLHWQVMEIDEINRTMTISYYREL